MSQQDRIRDVYSKYDQSRWDTTANRANKILEDQRDRHLVEVIGALELAPGSRVLDIGCGYGHIGNLIKSSFPSIEVTGVEILWDRCARAQETGLPVAQVDGDHLPVRSTSIDTAVLATVLSSVPRESLSAVLREIDRCLRPNGSVVVFDMHLPSRNPNVKRITTSTLSKLCPQFEIARRTLLMPPPIVRKFPDSLLDRYDSIERRSPLRSHSIWTMRRSNEGRDSNS